jgi:long-chain fatty acid transport protein
MRRSAITILCASCLLSTSAYATGFDLREFSASSLGTSYAGAGANGQHASTMPFNPALAGWVDDFDISVSATGVVPTATGDFTTATTSFGNPTGGTTAPSSIISKAIVPDIAIRKRLTDQFSVGVSLTVPWGLMTKYSDTWAGRYYATKSELMTYNITPVVAYQPVPELSIAAGLQVEYISGNLSKAIDFGLIGCSVNCSHYPPPPGMPFFNVLPGHDDGYVALKANNWAYSYILGVAWKPNDNLSLGLSYRGKIDHKLSGTETYTLDAGGVGAFFNAYVPTQTFLNSAATAKITLPSVVNVSTRLRVDDKWTVMATVDWTGWSSFKQLLILSAQPHNSADLTTFGWKDSWFGSIGAEYKADDQWTLRAGTAYDETPTPSGAATPGIPDSSRIWLSGGIGYRLSDDMDLDFSVAHLFSGTSRINQSVSAPTGENAARGTLIGTVSTGVTLIGMELTYR